MDSPAPLSRDVVSSVGDLVTSTMGLHFPPERRPDLERAIAAAGRDAGCSADAFAHALLRSAHADRGVEERRLLETLASYVTIGETYFFREPEALGVFEREILPELIRARSADRRLRIWSAGCATGEEPYTIAMILDRLLGEARDWNITILATDINSRFLRKAVEGVYGEWSFRRMPFGARERWFRPRSDGRWELHPRIRERVTFSCLNLADDAYPSLLSGTNAMDVVFCRNVLMYFTPSRAKEIAEKFHRSLVDGGWLFTAAAETSKEIFSAFLAVQKSEGTFYRKAVVPHSRPAAVLVEPEVPRTAPVQAAKPPVLDHLAHARRLANEGKLREAAEACARAIAAGKMDPAAHYLLAAIQSEMGDRDTAVQSLTRALYVDPGFVLAHVGLANIEIARGRTDAARRHLNNALRALGSHPDDEILPESDGLTAARLKDIVSTLLTAMGEERE